MNWPHVPAAGMLTTAARVVTSDRRAKISNITAVTSVNRCRNKTLTTSKYSANQL